MENDKTKTTMTEADFRKSVQELFDKVDRAFEKVDPDRAEAEKGLGTLTILFPGGSKCILSTQPTIRQIWMAVAARGVAFHFNKDPQTGLWMDDKNKGIELIAYLKAYLRDEARLDLNL